MASENAEPSNASDTPPEAEGHPRPEADAPGAGAAAEAPASRPSGSEPAGKGGRGTSKRPTAGQRLAAARAAKAARKAADRGRTAEAVEQEAEQRVAVLGDWLRERTRLLLGVAGGLLAVVVGVALWGGYRDQAAAEASDELWAAVGAARAPLADAPDAVGATGEAFDTPEARAEAAVDRFSKVIEGHGGTAAATWARLGAGSARLELGEAEAARADFEAALGNADGDPVIAWRALEGLVLSYEAEGAYDEALERVERLSETADGAFARIAEYHAARLRLAKGDEDAAREGLRALLDSLRPAGGLEMAAGSGELPYVRREAERLLDALGGAASDETAEGIRRALEQLQQGAGGGTE